MRLHTGVKPYECPYCGERFRTSGHRKAHIYAIHPAVSETEIVKHDQQSTSHIRLVNFLLTFTYFEKATKICKNSPIFLCYQVMANKIYDLFKNSWKFEIQNFKFVKPWGEDYTAQKYLLMSSSEISESWIPHLRYFFTNF